MLAARVEPKNGPIENKKTDNFKPPILSEFQAAVDNNQDEPLIVARVGGRPAPRALSTASFRR